MANRLADYWCDVYLEQHGAKYPFRGRDAAVLKQVLADCGDKRALAWEIKEFHAKAWKSAWVAEAGYDCRMFARMHLGLHLEYVKRHEHKLAARKTSESADLARAEGTAVVLDLVARMGQRDAG